MRYQFVAGMSEWLDHSILPQRIPGSKSPSDLSPSVGREFASALSLQVKREKESRDVVTWRGRIRVALDLLQIDQYLTKIVSVLAYQRI